MLRLSLQMHHSVHVHDIGRHPPVRLAHLGNLFLQLLHLMLRRAGKFVDEADAVVVCRYLFVGQCRFFGRRVLATDAIQVVFAVRPKLGVLELGRLARVC